MWKPKFAAAVLVGGTVILVGGTAVAVALPSRGLFWRPADGPASAASQPAGSETPVAPGVSVELPSRLPPSVASQPIAVPTPTMVSGNSPPTAVAASSPAVGSVTYTVKPGDTLWGIADWFNLHGYGALYAANAAVIGRDPNLIRPGERITISNGAMTVQPPA